MNSDMGDVTKLAYRAVTDELALLNEFSTPESVLDYLQNENEPEAINIFLHNNEAFRGLSSVLKYIMVKAGICNESDPDSLFSDRLYEKLVKQDTECGNTKDRKKITVTRWINGKTASIRYRDSVIEICFALGLDLDLTNELLNKCGYNSLNVRNAAEATYMYCILNHRPFPVAKDLISKYAAWNADTVIANNIDRNAAVHSGSTTMILEQQLIEESSWESDETFLESFLIPNKAKFINYSSTTEQYYYRWKNNMFVTVIYDELRRELKQIDNNEETVVSKTDLKTLLALRSALRKYEDEFVTEDASMLFVITVLRKANELLTEKMDNALEVLNTIREAILNLEDMDAQHYFAVFLSDIMSTEAVLKQALWSIRSCDGRIRRYTGTEGSNLQTSVMKEFPNVESFTSFEKDPGIIDRGMTVRKLILIMYYITYAYEFSKYFYVRNYMSDIFGEPGFIEFMNGVNDIMQKCHFPPLYPANQFDWLILRCIRQFEIGEDYGEIDYEYDDPIALFNRVLAYSFGDEFNDSMLD